MTSFSLQVEVIIILEKKESILNRFNEKYMMLCKMVGCYREYADAANVQ